CYQERIALLGELAPKIGWLFADPAMDDAAQKNLAKEPAAGQWLAAFADHLEGINLPPSWPADRQQADDAVVLPSKKTLPSEIGPEPPCAFATPGAIERDTRAVVERLGVKFGSFVHPVRAALTGTDKGPGLFDVVFLLGRDTCVRRLRAAAGLGRQLGQ
ncbi:MAG TPA: hypothetical protein VFD82_18245, partial [Planctomycetota bacterium]|nr:hypothetical protein [Planctomycetota bacterium]